MLASCTAAVERTFWRMRFMNAIIARLTMAKPPVVNGLRVSFRLSLASIVEHIEKSNKRIVFSRASLEVDLMG